LGAPYEDVVLWSDPASIDRFVERGYRVDARRGDAAILRFSPCALDVVAELGPRGAPATGARPLFVQYGHVPRNDKAEMSVCPEGTTFRGGEARVHFAAPCGELWLRVFLDLDRSGKAGKNDAFCEGADGRGRLTKTLTREDSSFRCRLPAPDG